MTWNAGWGKKQVGSANTSAKLNEDKVREIRKRLAAGERPTPLAKEYGVSVSVIHHVGSRTSWKHVE